MNGKENMCGKIMCEFDKRVKGQKSVGSVGVNCSPENVDAALDPMDYLHHSNKINFITQSRDGTIFELRVHMRKVLVNNMTNMLQHHKLKATN